MVFVEILVATCRGVAALLVGDLKQAAVEVLKWANLMPIEVAL